MIANSRSGRAPSLGELLGIDPDATDWMRYGVCAQTDPDAFYPDKGGSTRPAKTVCAACPVRTECLAYAVEHGERYGVWGGTSERERRALRHKESPAVPDAA